MGYYLITVLNTTKSVVIIALIPFELHLLGDEIVAYFVVDVSFVRMAELVAALNSFDASSVSSLPARRG